MSGMPFRQQGMDSNVPLFAASRRMGPQQRPTQPNVSATRVQTKPKSKTYTYSSIFNKVLLQRLKFYGRISGFVSFVLVCLVTIFGRGSIAYIPIKLPLIWIGFIVIRFARDITLKVESSSYPSPFSSFIGHILSGDFLTYFIAFLSSSLLYYTIVVSQYADFTYYISSPTKTVKPIANDVFFYTWYFVVVSTFFYASKYVVQEKNMISFSIGVYRLPQEEGLKSINFIQMMKDTVIFNLILTLVLPVTYIFSRSFIHNFILYPVYFMTGLNDRVPGFKFSFSTYFVLFIANCSLNLSWELLNEVYSIFVRIGCLSSGKPLSNFSEDPINTLLSGLKDIKNPIVRLTAFQELAYLSSSPNVNDRKVFYTGFFKGSRVWYIILEECTQVVKAACRSITNDLIIGGATEVKSNETQSSKSNSDFLFGNSGVTTNGIFDAMNYNNTNHNVNINQTLKMENKKIEDPLATLLKNPEKVKEKKKNDFDFMEFIKTVEAPEIVKRMLKATDMTKERLEILQKSLMNNKFGSFFVSDINREANRRLTNPTNLGNCMMALTEILLHARVEDNNVNITTQNLTQVLILLTKVYKSCSEFLNHSPNSITIVDAKSQHNCIAEIHEISLLCICQLAITYNPILNDLVLPQDVFELASWCIDLAIEDQNRKAFEDQNKISTN